MKWRLALSSERIWTLFSKYFTNVFLEFSIGFSISVFISHVINTIMEENTRDVNSGLDSCILVTIYSLLSLFSAD